MRHTPIRNISEEEKKELYGILDSVSTSSIKYRTKIILLAGEGYTVPEIRQMTNIYDKTIRKWIHRFNDYGVKGIFIEIDYSGMIKISEKDKKDIIICIASTNPRILGLKFSTWSLRTIAGYVKEKIIQQDNNNSISHTTVRDILREQSIEWRHSKTVLAESNDPEYDLKKAHR